MKFLVFSLLAAILPVTGGPCAEPVLVSQAAPSSVVSLRSRDLGIIGNIFIKQGDSVSKDQEVVRLEDYLQVYSFEAAKRRVNDQKALTVAQADFREKEALLEEANAKLKRKEISPAQLLGAFTAREASKAGLERAQEGLEQAKRDLDLSAWLLDRRTVKSPVFGKVLEVLKTVGENVVPGEAIVKVGDFSKLKAEIPLSKEAASKLVAGDFFTVKTSPSGPPVKALVESLSPVPNSTNGASVVKLIFDNPELKGERKGPDK
ncbi:MAG: HlyD family efflux transporter periplasmic adaptor subunit [Verrucomicrobia bacterium]|nr:HlyD family efflux transporter periplasmic adaptor subunit [Verrucomicrobiota bacterium]